MPFSGLAVFLACIVRLPQIRVTASGADGPSGPPVLRTEERDDQIMVYRVGDVSAGRLVYQKTCHQCHKLFGEGVKIGPNLTGSNRENLDYVLENVLDPDSVVGKGYQLTSVLTDAGRIVQGIVLEQSDDAVTIQIKNERIVIPRDDIDEVKVSEKSMMPTGQLELLTREQTRDLIAYLASPSQVPLPDVKE